MKHLKDELRSTNRSIINQKEVATAKQIEAAEEHREAAEPELTEMTLPNAYERHLVTFIQEEKAAFQDGDGEPLCDCSNPYCPLKKGELPAKVEMADHLEEGIRRYRRQHDGDARVLKDGREKWVEKYSTVKMHLEDALVALRRTPEPEPETDTEPEAAD